MADWEEVSADAEFQALPAEEKGRIKKNYFDAEIAPNVPPDQFEAVKASFFEEAPAAAPQEPAARVPAAARQNPGDYSILAPKMTGGSPEARQAAMKDIGQTLEAPARFVEDAVRQGYREIPKKFGLPVEPDQKVPGEDVAAAAGRMAGDTGAFMAGAAVMPGLAGAGAVARYGNAALQGAGGMLAVHSLADMAKNGEIDPKDAAIAGAYGAAGGMLLQGGADAVGSFLSSKAAQAVERAAKAAGRRIETELNTLAYRIKKGLGLPQETGMVPFDFKQAVAEGRMTIPEAAKQSQEIFDRELKARGLRPGVSPEADQAMAKDAVDALVDSGVPRDQALQQVQAKIEEMAASMPPPKASEVAPPAAAEPALPAAPVAPAETAPAIAPEIQAVMAETGITDPEIAKSLSIPPPAETPVAAELAQSPAPHDAAETTDGDVSFYEPAMEAYHAPATPEELAAAKAEANKPPYAVTPEELAQRFPQATPEVQGRLLAQIKASEAENAARSAAVPPSETPTPLSDLVRKTGMRAQDVKEYRGEIPESLRRGIARKNGLEPDRLREAAIEAGLLPPEATLNDFWDLLDSEARKGPKSAIKTPEQAAGVPKGAPMAAPPLSPRAPDLMPEEVAATLEQGGLKVGSKAPMIRRFKDPVFGMIKKGEIVDILSVDMNGGNILIEYGSDLGGRQLAIVPLQALAKPVTIAAPEAASGREVKASVAESTGVKPANDDIVVSEAKALREVIRARAKGSREGARAMREKMKADIKSEIHKRLELEVRGDWAEAIRKKIASYARENLPMAERGALLTRVANAKTWANLLKAFTAIDERATLVRNKELMGDIRILADRALNSKTFPVGFKSMVRELLENVRLESWGPRTIESIKLQQEFLDHIRSTGADVTVPQWVLEQVTKLGLRPLSQISNEELEEILGNLQYLIASGQDTRRAINALAEIQRQEWLAEIVRGSTDKTMQQYASSRSGVQRGFMRPALSWAQKRKNEWLRLVDAYQEAGIAMTPIQVIVDEGGAAERRILYEPLQEGYIQRVGEIAKAHDAVSALLAKHGVPDQLSQDRILTVAYRDQPDIRPHLHKMDLTDAEIDAVKLTDSEQAILNELRNYFADENNINALARVSAEVYNQDFVPVEKYFPVMTKYERTAEGEGPLDVIRDELDLRRKNVDRGRIIERQIGAARKLRTDLFGIFLDAARQQANLKYMAKPILKAHAIVRDNAYLEAKGDARQDFWKDYLDTLARDGHFKRSKAEWVLDYFRKNLAKGALSFKPNVALIQFSSMGTGAAATGGKAMGQALMAGPEWGDFVDKNMPLIVERKGGDPAVNEVLRGSLLPGIEKAAFKHIVAADYYAAKKVALAAYFQYLDRHGIEPDPGKPLPAALNHAQAVVGRVMASPWLVDMPLALSRGGPLAKSLLQFQSETLAKFAFLTHDVFGKQGGSVADRVQDLGFLGASLLYEAGVRRMWRLGMYGVLAGIGAITKKQYDKAIEKDDSYFKQVGLAAVNSVPLVGSVANYMVYDSGLVPVIDVAGDAAKGASNAVIGTVQNRPIKAMRGLIQSLTAAAQLAGIHGSGLAGWVAKQPLRGRTDRIERSKRKAKKK